jgi:hypothetical protein
MLRQGWQTDFLGTPHTGAVVKLNDKQAFIAAVDSLRLDAAAREHQASQSGDGGKLLH